MIVMVLAAATALRFYFVSWIGERTVADLRKALQDRIYVFVQSPLSWEGKEPDADEKQVIFDSLAIMEYASELAGGALLPRDPRERAHVRSLLAWQQQYMVVRKD